MSSSSKSSPLSAEARREKIKRDVQQSGFLSVRNLTEELGVSDMTIRRDLRRLENENAVRIVHGGASLPVGADYRQRGQSEADAKFVIARYTASMLPSTATVLMDAGTTVAAVADALPDSFAGYIITHSVPVIEALIDCPQIHVHCLGGELREESRAMVGPTTVENLQKVTAQVLLLGAAAINEHGIFVDKDLERGTKTAFIKSSQRVILVVDHTKFTKFSPVLLAPLDIIDEIVTDREPPGQLMTRLRELGIKVHIVGE